MNARPLIGATAMVYGFDMAENLRQLSAHVRHAELLLYWTPAENNFPAAAKVAELKALAGDLNLSLSVHLPPMLDLITGSAAERQRHLDLLCNLIQTLQLLDPTGYVLHLGPHTPKLTANPVKYLPADGHCDLAFWYDRGLAALSALQSATGLGPRLLIENLDFSPLLLRPFLEAGLAGLCFDAGHVWLGRENLATAFAPLWAYVQEIHLHGVKGNMEHLSLSELSCENRREFTDLLLQWNYTKLVNLEVFTPDDLKTSLLYLQPFLHIE